MYRTNLFVDSVQMRKLAALGKSRGLKVAPLIRLAISEFIRREAACDARAAKQGAQGE